MENVIAQINQQITKLNSELAEVNESFYLKQYSPFSIPYFLRQMSITWQVTRLTNLRRALTNPDLHKGFEGNCFNEIQSTISQSCQAFKPNYNKQQHELEELKTRMEYSKFLYKLCRANKMDSVKQFSEFMSDF